jgi:hypothetical protein
MVVQQLWQQTMTDALLSCCGGRGHVRSLCCCCGRNVSHGRHPPLCCVVVVHPHVTSSVIVRICCIIAPPPRVAEGKGRVTVAIPGAHSEGAGNTVTVMCASPPVDVMARLEGTIDVPCSHCNVALN